MTPDPPYSHLLRLSDARGIIEHAHGATPDTRGGYCLDDAARGLIVACRASGVGPQLSHREAVYFSFVLASQAPDGRCRNRLGADNRWADQPDLGDWWGRALWALGTAAAHSAQSWICAAAPDRFRRSAKRRSPYLRTMAFAALGAAEILTVRPDLPCAYELLTDLATMVGRPDFSSPWPWPQPRLTYANAAIAEAMIAAGHGLRDDAILADGLGLLGWLLETETYDGHLSVTPTGGRGPGDPQPAYDQQPIEVAALADACVRALDITGDPRWADGLDLAVGWFLGANDRGVTMWDADTGGGFDALTPGGRNTNQGAESTLAMVSTLQHAHRLPLVSR